MAITEQQVQNYLVAGKGFVKATMYEDADMAVDSTLEEAEVIIIPSEAGDALDDSDQIEVYRVTKTFKNAGGDVIGKQVYITDTRPTWVTESEEEAIVD